MDEINKPLLFGVLGVILLFLLGLPLLNQLQQGSAGGGAATATGGTAAESTEPGQYRSEPSAAPGAPVASSAPPVTAASLENTTWQFNTERGTVTVNFLPGGRVIATPPPALAGMVQQMTGRSTLDGTWSLSGNNITASVSAMGQTQTINAQVVNGTIQYEGQAAQRVN